MESDDLTRARAFAANYTFPWIDPDGHFGADGDDGAGNYGDETSQDASVEEEDLVVQSHIDGGPTLVNGRHDSNGSALTNGEYAASGTDLINHVGTSPSWGMR